jgi:GT2 family glycosyltransferase
MINKNMKVYAIIVTFNGSPWISRCLDGLRNSTITPSVTIVDNNSNDNTVEIIKNSYPEVTLLESKENLGFGKANNIGITHALKRGADYFFLLNQDAWIFPDTLQSLIHANKKMPEYLIVSPIHLDGTGNRLDYNFIKYIKKSDDFINDLIVKRDLKKNIYSLPFINAAFWLLSKRCVLDIGAFDPLYKHYGEDEDYANRVKYHGYKIGVCPNVFGVHDRDQKPVAFHEMTGKKRFNRHYKNYLTELKNINRPFSICMLNVLKKIILKSIILFIKLQLSNCWIEIKAGLYLLVQLKKVYRHRNLVKSKGPVFLDGIQNILDNTKNIDALFKNLS